MLWVQKIPGRNFRVMKNVITMVKGYKKIFWLNWCQILNNVNKGYSSIFRNSLNWAMKLCNNIVNSQKNFRSSEFTLSNKLQLRFMGIFLPTQYYMMIKISRLAFREKKRNKEQPFQFVVDYRTSSKVHPTSEKFQLLISVAPQNVAFIKKMSISNHY